MNRNVWCGVKRKEPQNLIGRLTFSHTHLVRKYVLMMQFVNNSTAWTTIITENKNKIPGYHWDILSPSNLLKIYFFKKLPFYMRSTAIFILLPIIKCLRFFQKTTKFLFRKSSFQKILPFYRLSTANLRNIGTKKFSESKGQKNARFCRIS